MDTAMTYQTIVSRIMHEYAEKYGLRPKPEVDHVLIADEQHGEYILLAIGWEAKLRVRHINLYVRIRNGKVWVEEDWTEEGITTRLLEAGVPKEDIVLGFQHPSMRPLTEFAVA